MTQSVLRIHSRFLSSCKSPELLSNTRIFTASYTQTIFGTSILPKNDVASRHFSLSTCLPCFQNKVLLSFPVPSCRTKDVQLNRGFAARNYSSKQVEEEKKNEKIVLYRGPFLLPLRFLIRMKFLQLAGAGSVLVPGAVVLQGGTLSASQLMGLGCLFTGCVGASAALWYFGLRYVGELSVLAGQPGQVRVSTLDFWGSRCDADIPISEIEPPLAGLPVQERARLAHAPFIPLNVAGDRQFLVSLRHGDLRDRDRLFKLLEGIEMDSV